MEDKINISMQMKRLKLRRGISIAYLSINSIRNKIELLKPTILETVDILVIAETKLDNTFATSQFTINGSHPPFRYDRNMNGGGLLIYMREGVPAKQLQDFTTPDDIECGIIRGGSRHSPHSHGRMSDFMAEKLSVINSRLHNICNVYFLI